ncbi:MAG: calcium/sodium antiporter [Clostridia bacterium]|nr:calcium/sodium antiporter [Clostridia bacterium]
MQIVLNLLLLLACFAILIKGADFLVDACSFIAKKLKVPSLIIGLTIVAFGTSAPEAGVSIVSSLQGSNSLSISNVVGSNLFNLLVIVGLCSIIGNIVVDKEIIKFDYPVCLLASILLVFFVRDMAVERLEGIVLLVLIVVYCVYLISRAKRTPAQQDEENKETGKGSLKVFLNIVIIIVSIAAIYFASKGIVSSCTFFAKLFGISDTVIGLTIVALGTSLPELVTSLVAHKKGEYSIALGNIIGSNLFNILFVLGIASTISPLELCYDNVVDAIICFVGMAVCYIFVCSGAKIKKSEGVIMLIMYAAYMTFVFLREFGIIIL